MDHVKSSHFSFYSTYAIITKKKKKDAVTYVYYNNDTSVAVHCENLSSFVHFL